MKTYPKHKDHQINFQQIYQILKEILPNLKQQYQVKSLGIFGSYVRGEATENSDLDLLVEFEYNLTFDNYMNLKFFLEDLFNKKIDLVIKEDLKPQISQFILEETVNVS